jgi:predicted alpha/beta superfamily hydrolase
LVKTKALIDTSKVYITGNNSLLGNWNPSKVSLTEINDSTWERTFSFEPETSLEYKFTLGSWGTEASNSDGAVSSNITLEVLEDTTVQISISNWKENEENKISVQITGRVKYHRNFPGDGIKPRDIIVWLPPDYEKDTTKRYSVLYMHDGENIFDPATSSFGLDWQLDETADSLIKSEKIKGIIIVGIYNTIDRSAEYEDTEKGRMYMKFIVNELKPFIDKNYRTKPDRGNTATGGSSLGGLISFMLAWEYPNIFSKAACISPAFYIKDIDYLKTVKNYNGSKKQIKIYIDDGGIGLEKRLQPGIDSMIVLLNQKQYVDGKDYIFYKDINAEHSEYFWAKRAWRFLEFFFPK